jgi:hypothetical protein
LTEAAASRRVAGARLAAVTRALDSRVPTRTLLRFVAQLEGARLPSGEELATQLGVTRKAAYQLLTRLRESGILRTITATQPGDLLCECVAYLRCWMTNPADLAALEKRLAGDPSVTLVAQITGAHNYRIEAFHPDFIKAQAWFRILLLDDAVSQGELRFTRTVLRRFSVAAALLEGDTAPEGEA